MFNSPMIDTWSAVMEQLDGMSGDITDAVESIIEDAVQNIDMHQWVCGDAILKAGTDKYTLERFEKASRKKTATLRSWVTTCKMWSPDDRWEMISNHPYLSFAMFKECNSLVSDADYGIDVAKDVLKTASEKLFTVKELTRYIAVEIRDKQPDKQWVEIADTVGITWVNQELETLNLELGDEMAGILEPSKKYRVKIMELQADE